jgi:hypothetical protein
MVGHLLRVPLLGVADKFLRLTSDSRYIDTNDAGRVSVDTCRRTWISPA